jgi:hypothetical protein
VTDYDDNGFVLNHDNELIVGQGSGKLSCFQPDGILKWSVDLGSSILENIAVTGNGTIYASKRNYCLDALDKDGRLLWSIDFEYPISPPTVDGEGTIYLSSREVYAISPGGEILWTFSIFGEHINKEILIDRENGFYCIDWKGMLIHARRSMSPPPQNLTTRPYYDMVILSWSEPQDLNAEEFVCYRVYRYKFPPDLTLIGETTDVTFNDTTMAEGWHYYFTTTVTIHGESNPSNTGYTCYNDVPDGYYDEIDDDVIDDHHIDDDIIDDDVDPTDDDEITPDDDPGNIEEDRVADDRFIDQIQKTSKIIAISLVLFVVIAIILIISLIFGIQRIMKKRKTSSDGSTEQGHVETIETVDMRMEPPLIEQGKL